MQEAKQGHQLRALFLKNLTIQKRQPCTNICQIITPIICLVFTMLIRDVAIDNIPSQNEGIYEQMPLLPIKLNNYSLIDQFDPEWFHRNKMQWFVYDYSDKASLDFIGENYGNGTRKGLLGNIQKSCPYKALFNYSITSPIYPQYVTVPTFRKPQYNRSIDKQLFERFQFLNTQNMDALKHTSTSSHLPDGSIYFENANSTKLKANIRVKDVRQFLFYVANGISKFLIKKSSNSTRYTSYYVIPQGFLTVIDMINKAFIKTTINKTVQSGYIYMPLEVQGSVFVDILINTVATILFPLSLSLLLPVFLYFIVLQKQQKLIQMMRMNGMNMMSYWSVTFLYNLTISLLTNLVFFTFGFIFLDNGFFHQTNLAIMFVVLLGWILSQIGMSFLFQVFLSNSRAANIIGYLISIWTNLIGATLSVALFQYPVQLPTAYCLWPTFSFNRLFYLMFTSCSNDQCLTSFDNLTPEMWKCIIIMYSSFFIFSLLGMYLFEVVPQQYGVSQPLLFPFYFIRDKFLQKKNSIKSFEQTEKNKELHDETITDQIAKIKQIENCKDYALIASSLTKQYDNGKLAVNDFNIVIEDKQIFGLLGPNGAGKTTLLSMITGIFKPTEGTAYIGGYCISDQIDKVHLQMGVCPQFDIQWPILTVEEHLYFYARLKGIPISEQKNRVNETLEEINLTNERNFKVSQLSGGMKRRLSVGISLVGNPRIIFMDEPTTGLDPQNRRHLWEVLSKCRSKRSIFLTTHLMEEAESLCDSIGIITEGSIRTFGDQFRLKDIYGKGYFVSVNVELDKKNILGIRNQQESLNADEIEVEQSFDSRSFESSLSELSNIGPDPQIQRINIDKMHCIKQKLQEMFPDGQICKQIQGYIKINVGARKTSELLEQVNSIQVKGINFQWSINNSTLEDVFLEVVKKFQKTQKKEKNSLLESIQHEIE